MAETDDTEPAHPEVVRRRTEWTWPTSWKAAVAGSCSGTHEPDRQQRRRPNTEPARLPCPAVMRSSVSDLPLPTTSAVWGRMGGVKLVQ